MVIFTLKFLLDTFTLNLGMLAWVRLMVVRTLGSVILYIIFKNHRLKRQTCCVFCIEMNAFNGLTMDVVCSDFDVSGTSSQPIISSCSKLSEYFICIRISRLESFSNLPSILFASIAASSAAWPFLSKVFTFAPLSIRSWRIFPDPLQEFGHREGTKKLLATSNTKLSNSHSSFGLIYLDLQLSLMVFYPELPFG